MIDLDLYTVDALLSAMLSRVPDDLDKREGSIIYDALAPAAYELADLYKALDESYEASFLETAQGEALDMRGAEMGIYRRDAGKALRTAKFFDVEEAPFDISIGLRFSTVDGEKSENFSVFEKIDDGIYALEADEGGSQANHYIGSLLPIQFVEGLAACEMVGMPILAGTDAEDDESFRSRYLYKVKNEPVDANQATYLQWALEYPGIGKAKVFPLWNGDNTVKVSVLGSDDMPCSPQLVSDFQTYLDPDSEGLGNGVAPIGAKVTVTTVTLKNINVAFTFSLAAGKDKTQVKALIQTAINEYFRAISYRKSKVYYMEVGAVILSVDGVEALTSLTLNQGSSDIVLGDEERPLLNDYSAEVGA